MGLAQGAQVVVDHKDVHQPLTSLPMHLRQFYLDAQTHYAYCFCCCGTYIHEVA